MSFAHWCIPSLFIIFLFGTGFICIEAQWTGLGTTECFAQNSEDANVCSGEGFCVANDTCACTVGDSLGPACSLNPCRTEVVLFGELAAPHGYQRLELDLKVNQENRYNYYRDPILYLDVGRDHAVFASKKWVYTFGKSGPGLGRAPHDPSVYSTSEVYTQNTAKSTAASSFDDVSATAGERVIGVCAGDDFSFFFTQHRIFCTGDKNGVCLSSLNDSFGFIFPSFDRKDMHFACGQRHAVLSGAEDGDFVYMSGYYTSDTNTAPSEQPGFTQIGDAQSLVVSVAAGNDISLFLTTEGEVYGWGLSDLLSSLAAGPHGVAQPTLLDFSHLLQQIGGGTIRDRIVGISCNGDYVLMTTGRGKVIAWGNEMYGNLGLTDSKASDSRVVPFDQAQYTHDIYVGEQQIPTFEDDKSHAYLAFAGANYTSFVIGRYFSQWAFGDGRTGLFGNNESMVTEKPVRLDQLSPLPPFWYASNDKMTIALTGHLRNNECKCPPGKSGEMCDEWTCFGVNRFDENVCGGRGKCVCPDRCSCDSFEDYGGLDCRVSKCNATYALDPNVCNHHGECVAPHQCDCDHGYYGPDCQYTGFPTCFGLISYAPGICSGHGECIDDDSCICADGYTDAECQTPIKCGGFDWNNPDVCSGHGTCTGADICDCEPGYGGLLCSVSNCYGRVETDPGVCSGHGDCVGPNDCQCDPGYYYGTQCQSFSCNSTNGNCPSFADCDETSFTCICPPGFEGILCDRCTPGLYGEWCNVSVSEFFYWESSLKRIQGTIRNASKTFSSSNCSSVLKTDTLALLGTNPTCDLDADGNFFITLGSDPSMRVVETFKINTYFNEMPGADYPDHYYATVEVLGPTNPPLINIVQFDTTPGGYSHHPCDQIDLNVKVDMGNFPSGDIWTKKIFYSISGSEEYCVSSKLREHVNTLTGTGTKSIPGIFRPECEYTVTMLVRTNFCQEEKQSLTIFTNGSIPIPTIMSFPEELHISIDSFELEGDISKDLDCTDSEVYWTIQPVTPHYLTNNRFKFNIEAYTFPFKDADYDIGFHVRSKFGLSRTYRQTLQVVRPPVRAIVSGSRFRSMNADGSYFSVDGSESDDPYAHLCAPDCGTYSYEWECFDYVDPSIPCPYSDQLSNTAVVDKLSSLDGAGRTLVFVLTYSNHGRPSSESQVIEFVEYDGPKGRLEGPQYVISDTTSTFEFIVLDEDDNLTFEWIVSQGFTVNSSTVYGSVSDTSMIIRENILTPGLYYVFGCLVTETVSRIERFFKLERLVYQRPKNGILQVSPDSGTTSETEFTVSTQDWQATGALEYQFGLSLDGVFIALSSYSDNSTFSTIVSGIVGDVAFAVRARDKEIEEVGEALSPTISVSDDLGSDPDLDDILENAKNQTKDPSKDPLQQLLIAVRSLNRAQTYSKFPLEFGVCESSSCSDQGACVLDRVCACDDGFAGDRCSLPMSFWEGDLALRAQFLDILTNIEGEKTCDNLSKKLLILENLLLHRDTTTVSLTKSVVDFAMDLLSSESICTQQHLNSVVRLLSNAYNSILSIRARSDFSKLLEYIDVADIDKINQIAYNLLHEAMDQYAADSSNFENVGFSSDWVSIGLYSQFVSDLEPSRKRLVSDIVGDTLVNATFASTYKNQDQIALQSSSIHLNTIGLLSRNTTVKLDEIKSDVASIRPVDSATGEPTDVTATGIRIPVNGTFDEIKDRNTFYCQRIHYKARIDDDDSDWVEACIFEHISDTVGVCECAFSEDRRSQQVGVFSRPMASPPSPPSDTAPRVWIVFVIVGVGLAICMGALLIFCIALCLCCGAVFLRVYARRKKQRTIESVASADSSVFDDITHVHQSNKLSRDDDSQHPKQVVSCDTLSTFVESSEATPRKSQSTTAHSVRNIRNVSRSTISLNDMPLRNVTPQPSSLGSVTASGTSLDSAGSSSTRRPPRSRPPPPSQDTPPPQSSTPPQYRSSPSPRAPPKAKAPPARRAPPP